MPPSDPAAVPPPEWAVEMAGAYFDLLRAMPGRPQYREHLAAFLAAFREATMREAADKAMSLGGSAYPSDCHDAILSLLHTPPSGGADPVADELFRNAPESEDDPV